MQNCAECSGKKWFAKINKETGLQEKHHKVKESGFEYDLRVWVCWRCGNVQEEVMPFIPILQRSRAHILYIDLEVSKSAYYSYGRRVPSRYLDSADLIREYYIICWSASYLGSSKIWSGCVTPEQANAWSDAEILKPLRDLMESADIIAGHNVDRYDMKRANTRFLLNGLGAVINKKTIDTLKIARSKFEFESNKLDDVSQRLGFRPKDNIRKEDWLKIVKTGDEKTLKKVLKYNRGDVANGKAVLETLLPYSGKNKKYGSVSLESPSPEWLKMI